MAKTYNTCAKIAFHFILRDFLNFQKLSTLQYQEDSNMEEFLGKQSIQIHRSSRWWD